MGDLVVSLPFEAGSFDALNELFGLVSVGGEGGPSKAVARGGLWGGGEVEAWGMQQLGKKKERSGGKKKNQNFF